MALPDPNNCALDANGQLKDADNIVFYYSTGDNKPIQKLVKINANVGKAPTAGPSWTSMCPVMLTDLEGLTPAFGQRPKRERLQLSRLRLLLAASARRSFPQRKPKQLLEIWSQTINSNTRPSRLAPMPPNSNSHHQRKKPEKHVSPTVMMSLKERIPVMRKGTRLTLMSNCEHEPIHSNIRT